MGEILMIRHGKTCGNTQGRYIGSRTDEPLCEEGIRELQSLWENRCPTVDRLYVSPMKRCLETAALLWPGRERIPVSDLRECDFGDFENKNYRELDGNPDYQAWIDSGGTLPFPHGESQERFRERCCRAFKRIVQEMRAFEEAGEQEVRIGIVAHGGTIMAILEKYGFPAGNYFDYQVKNGCGFLLTSGEGTELWNYQYLL